MSDQTPEAAAAAVTSDEASAPGPAADDLRGPVLVVTAHPDDVDFGMAGTLAAWADAGLAITYCVVTDGDAGGNDHELSPIMGQVRRAEQEAAAAVVGVKEVIFLGYPDGRLEVTLDLRRDIARVIRHVRPERVLTQSPVRDLTRIYASHPDHLACGEATLCAVYPGARNPFAFTELAEAGLPPHTVTEVWIAGGPSPDTFVDTTDVFDRKLAALSCHVTQVGSWEPGRLEARLRDWGERTAASAGLPPGRLAESFQRIDTR